MQLPAALLQSLESLPGFNPDAFLKVHQSGEQVTSIRLNPLKSFLWNVGQNSVSYSPLILEGKVPWTNYGYYLAERPSFTFDPLFHAGCYYVQEASSMFLEQAMKQTVDLSKPLRVLDLCAAPGGKSTHLLSLLSAESLLVSNDVIRSRAGLLKDNITKWGCANVLVSQNDPKDFQRFENYFDVIVVDAPCSGSGLFRRDPAAMDEWSLQNVTLCSRRQQRILADVLPALKKEGILIYSTCSYSKEENEEIADWMTKELPLINCPLTISPQWGITPVAGSYRFWPHLVKGEGFFISCFKKTTGKVAMPGIKKHTEEKFSKEQRQHIHFFLQSEGYRFFRYHQLIHAVPEILLDEIRWLSTFLQVVNAGMVVGEIIRDKLVPDHALSMSPLVSEKINRIALNKQQAIQYLQKKDIQIGQTDKGWSLVTYENYPLGWINVLPNRINNYYPRTLRILKDKDN